METSYRVKRKVKSGEKTEGGNISDVEICNDQLPTSPVLNKRSKLCVDKSPVIVTDKKNLIKLKKAVLSSRNELHGFGRKLIDNFENNIKTEDCVLATKCYVPDVCPDKQTQSLSCDVITTLEEDRISSPSNSIDQQTLEIDSARSSDEEMFSIQCDISHSSSRSSVISPGNIDVHSSPDSFIATDISYTSSAIGDSITQMETRDKEARVVSELKIKQNKKFKKGTYGYSLQRLLVKQRNDIALWQHENYLTSTTDIEGFQIQRDHSVIELKIASVSSLFGCTLLDCRGGRSWSERCFLLPPSNVDVNLYAGHVIEIFPSYYVSYLNCNNHKLLSNVHKIRVKSRVDL